METEPGLLSAVLDRSFNTMITIRVLRLLYTLALAGITGINLVVFWIGWGLTGAGPFWSSLGWLTVAGAAPLWLAEVVAVRLAVEYLIVQHKISADVSAVRQALTEGFRRGAPPPELRDESGGRA